MIRSDGFSFPWGQMILKIVQIICLFLAAVMAGAWSSEGISFTDLNSGDTNQRAYFEFLLVVTVAGMIWAIASIILVFPFKQTLPPLAILIVTSIISFLLLISASLFIRGIVTLSESSLARTKQLNLSVLEAACFFSIMGVVSYIGDLVLEIIATVFLLRNLGFNKFYMSSFCGADEK